MQNDSKQPRDAGAVNSTRFLDGLSTRAVNRIYYACKRFGIPIEKVKEGIANHILKPAKWRDCGEKTDQGTRSMGWDFNDVQRAADSGRPTRAMSHWPVANQNHKYAT